MERKTKEELIAKYGEDRIVQIHNIRDSRCYETALKEMPDFIIDLQLLIFYDPGKLILHIYI